MKSSCCLLLFLVWACVASADVESVLSGLEPSPSGREGVAGVLWDIVADEDYAARLLGGVDSRQLVLADTLLSVLRMTEPQLRQLLPDMYVVSDFGRPEGESAPDWAQVRWAGVRWMRRIVEFGGDARDRRLGDNLDREFKTVGRPQRGEMGGLVEIIVGWWADRGLDPALTHHSPPRDPAARALAMAEEDRPTPGLDLLMAMDRDPVVRERVLARLDIDETAWLVRDFMLAVEVDTDSLRVLGVPGRNWDPAVGIMRGHATLGLRRLALASLDQTSPAVVSGLDDLTRRIARLSWWDDARFEARYWPHPQDAPDFSPFLLGLDRPVSEGGRDLMQWVRLVHLQSPGTQRRILGQLSDGQAPVVAELMGLAELERDEAAGHGFRMVYRRRPLVQSETGREVAVAIDWTAVRDLTRRMLAAITGQQPPDVLLAAPESLAGWWADWWADERSDEHWYRGPLADYLELPDAGPRLDLRPGRGRVD